MSLTKRLYDMTDFEDMDAWLETGAIQGYPIQPEESEEDGI